MSTKQELLASYNSARDCVAGMLAVSQLADSTVVHLDDADQINRMCGHITALKCLSEQSLNALDALEKQLFFS